MDPGPSPKRFLTSASAASRSQSVPSLCSGRQGSSTGAGQQLRLQRRGSCGRRGEPELGGAAVGLLAGQQVVVHLHDHPGALAELLAEALAVDLLAATGRPGAEPGRVVDLRRRCCAGRSCRSRSSPGRAWRRPSARPPRPGRPAPGTGSRGAPRRGCPGSTLKPVMNWSLGDLRVEQEAAVVVGADAGRRRGRVVLRHPHGDPALARRSGLCRTGAACAWRAPCVRRGRSCGSWAVASGAARGVGVGVACSDVPQAESSERQGAEPTATASVRREARSERHPGGQVMARPPSTCMWAWKTVWWAAAPVLNTRR